MLKQKYKNGYWIGKTFFVCPGCISLFHLVPFLFVCAILLSGILAFMGIAFPAMALWIAYACANIVMTVAAIVGHKERNAYSFLLPFIFLLLHLSYGAGTMMGFLSRGKNE